jgi:predicted metal-dependent peptidase
MVHIIYTMLANTGDDELALFTEEIQFEAATDGMQLIFKPSGFFARPLMKRVFMVLHEVMHEILNHVRMSWHLMKDGKITFNGQTLPFNQVFANVVQDLGINATLVAAKWGEFDEAWLFDKDLMAEHSTWIELYFQLWKANPPPPPNPKPKSGKGKPDPNAKPGEGEPDPNGTPMPGYGPPGKGFDEHLKPGESQGKDAHEVPERNEIAWEQAVNTAMEIQRAQGKLPASMEHFFNTVLKPNVDWTEHVRGELVRISGSDTYDWQKLDRRLAVRGVGSPGLSGFSCGLIVVGCDSSGSIFHDKTLTHRFLGETAGMLEDLNPREVRFLTCDTEIKQEIVLEDIDDLRRITVIKGGGGTSFVPVFDYIAEHDLQPDVLIYLTDMAGRFPEHEPDYPVIWGNIDPGVTTAPFGKIVVIPVNKED